MLMLTLWWRYFHFLDKTQSQPWLTFLWITFILVFSLWYHQPTQQEPIWRKKLLNAYFGDIMFINELKNVLESLYVFDLGIVPANSIHPHRLIIVLVRMITLTWIMTVWRRDQFLERGLVYSTQKLLERVHTEAKLSDLNINCSHSHFCLKIRQIFLMMLFLK